MAGHGEGARAYLAPQTTAASLSPGEGWPATAATDPRLGAFFPVDSSQGILWAQLGWGRAIGGTSGAGAARGER